MGGSLTIGRYGAARAGQMVAGGQLRDLPVILRTARIARLVLRAPQVPTALWTRRHDGLPIGTRLMTPRTPSSSWLMPETDPPAR